VTTRVGIPDRVAPVKPAATVPRARVNGLETLQALGKFARRKPLGAIGAIIVVALLVMAVFAERIAPYGYDETIRGARMQSPSMTYWLGTDNLSRDIWSRIVYGARVSITVGFATVGLAVLLATTVGISSGYFGGAYDLVVQRIVDAWLSFPYLVIVLSVMAVLGPGLFNVVISLAIIIAAVNSRVIRSATIAIAHGTYVEARSWPSPRSRSLASACHRRIRPGARCSPGPDAPTCSARPGWRSGPVSRSRSRCSASTCSATRCATCSIRGCADGDPARDQIVGRGDGPAFSRSSWCFRQYGAFLHGPSGLDVFPSRGY